MVAFSYGVRSSPSDSSCTALQLVKDMLPESSLKLFSRPPKRAFLPSSCYVIGSTEHLADLLNVDNELGVIVDSVKDGTACANGGANSCLIGRRRSTRRWTLLSKTMRNTLPPCCVKKQPTPELEAIPSYLPDTSFFSFTAMMVRRSLQIIWMQTP
ncbi:hypothetical protein TcYC6_0015400 [Trypanosoma cruzi]|nr:hypothetical protein TcYC6_0015400 [Trypanosoma cruzi]